MMPPAIDMKMTGEDPFSDGSFEDEMEDPLDVIRKI